MTNCITQYIQTNKHWVALYLMRVYLNIAINLMYLLKSYGPSSINSSLKQFNQYLDVWVMESGTIIIFYLHVTLPFELFAVVSMS